jgi:hypothetical protein
MAVIFRWTKRIFVGTSLLVCILTSLIRSLLSPLIFLSPSLLCVVEGRPLKVGSLEKLFILLIVYSLLYLNLIYQWCYTILIYIQVFQYPSIQLLHRTLIYSFTQTLFEVI